MSQSSVFGGFMSAIGFSNCLVVRGQTSLVKSQGGKGEGSWSASLSSEPGESFQCSSSLEASWKPSSLIPFFSKPFSEVRVHDQDGQPDLHLRIHRDGGRNEIAVINGQGAQSTEVRIPVGEVKISEESARELEALTASAIHVDHRASSNELRIVVGDSPYPVNVYSLCADGSLYNYTTKWVK